MNYPLLFCLIGTVGISSLASGMVRAAAEELNAEVRDRVAQAESKKMRLWQGLEWAGIALVLAGMFLPQRVLFTAASQRVLAIAGGLVLFCISNAATAWFSNSVYKREAPQTRASRAAFRGALLVTVAEIGLLTAVFLIVAARLDWFPNSKSTGQNAETAADESNEKSNWIDEDVALKELAGLDRDYVQGLVESGSLHTKTVAGKKMYRLNDVQYLKAKKKDAIPE